MKIKPGYLLREVMDMAVIIGVGSDNYTPNEIMSLNETGALLWHCLEKGAEKADLVDALLREYDTDAAAAQKDVDAFLIQLREKALIEE